MKVEFTEGCTTYALDVAGQPFNKANDLKIELIIKTLLAFIKTQCRKDKTYLQDLLISTTSRFGEEEYVSCCPQCGDSIYKSTLLLKKPRKQNQKGIKEYLSSFKVGETRIYDDTYTWESLRENAGKLKLVFGCAFKFSLPDKTITRIR